MGVITVLLNLQVLLCPANGDATHVHPCHITDQVGLWCYNHLRRNHRPCLGFVVADTHLFQSEGAQQPLFWGEGSSRFVFDGGLQFCNLRGLRPASPTHTNQASAGISSMFQGKFERDKQRQLRLKLKHEQ
jgi:hypothetical protein